MQVASAILSPTIYEIFNVKSKEEIRTLCEELHPATIAEKLNELNEQDIWQVLYMLDLQTRADIFSHLNDHHQIDIIHILKRNDIVDLLTEMSPDDRASLFNKLSDYTKEYILPALAQAEREDIRRLTAYDKGTAGSVMTSSYATLSPNFTAAEAIEKLREIAPDRETIYCAYVVNDKRQLLGYVTLKDLILARKDAKVADLMDDNVIYAHVDDDQEEAARKIQKYDLIALPVVNGGNALVGIITHDDAIDIITQEHTEDMEKFMGITGKHEVGVYLQTSALKHFKNRVYWIVGLAILGLFSGLVIHQFEDTLTTLLILALYMPMVADTGGNAGSQAATVIVRALALKEIKIKDFFRIIFKELQIGILLGMVLAIISWAKVVFLSKNVSLLPAFSLYYVGLAIAIALGIQVIVSTLIGAILPILAVKFKQDPAIVASPALTTIVDITGLLIYFMVAKILLGV